MAESQNDNNTPEGRRKRRTKCAIPRADAALASESTGSHPAPCGACKFLRRKCISGCIFAPYFSSDQGSAKFAAVHKVFGASNVSKLLFNLPVNKRHEAVLTICYEAQARLSDPVFGCVTTIFALQQQVAALQAEVAMVQNQLLNRKFMVANALQNSQQHQQMQQHIGMLQPAYSNNSCSSNNLMNISGFTSHYELAAETAPSSYSLDHLQTPKPGHDDDENEEESHLTMRFFTGHKF